MEHEQKLPGSYDLNRNTLLPTVESIPSQVIILVSYSVPMLCKISKKIKIAQNISIRSPQKYTVVEEICITLVLLLRVRGIGEQVDAKSYLC